mgnify:CR=1 FL=1
MASKNLTEIRQNTVDSSEILYFVNVPDDMALLMASSNTMDSGIETDDPADVTSKVAGHVIKSYKKTFTHEGPFLPDDPVCRFEEYLFDHDETGSKASVELVQLKTYDNNKAYRYQAVCEVTSGVGGDAQDKAQIAATYTIVSVAEEGTCTFDGKTGIATFTPSDGGQGV